MHHIIHFRRYLPARALFASGCHLLLVRLLSSTMLLMLMSTPFPQPPLATYPPSNWPSPSSYHLLKQTYLNLFTTGPVHIWTFYIGKSQLLSWYTIPTTEYLLHSFAEVVLSPTQQYYLSSSRTHLPSLYLSHVLLTVPTTIRTGYQLRLEFSWRPFPITKSLYYGRLVSTGLVWQKSSVCRNISIIESISTKEDTSE